MENWLSVSCQRDKNGNVQILGQHGDFSENPSTTALDMPGVPNEPGSGDPYITNKEESPRSSKSWYYPGTWHHVVLEWTKEETSDSGTAEIRIIVDGEKSPPLKESYEVKDDSDKLDFVNDVKKFKDTFLDIADQLTGSDSFEDIQDYCDCDLDFVTNKDAFVNFFNNPDNDKNMELFESNKFDFQEWDLHLGAVRPLITKMHEPPPPLSKTGFLFADKIIDDVQILAGKTWSGSKSSEEFRPDRYKSKSVYTGAIGPRKENTVEFKQMSSKGEILSRSATVYAPQLDTARTEVSVTFPDHKSGFFSEGDQLTYQVTLRSEGDWRTATPIMTSFLVKTSSEATYLDYSYIE